MRRVYRQLPVDLSLRVPQLKFRLAPIAKQEASEGSIFRFVFRGPHCLWTDDYELDECPSMDSTYQRTWEWYKCGNIATGDS